MSEFCLPASPCCSRDINHLGKKPRGFLKSQWETSSSDTGLVSFKSDKVTEPWREENICHPYCRANTAPPHPKLTGHRFPISRILRLHPHLQIQGSVKNLQEKYAAVLTTNRLFPCVSLKATPWGTHQHWSYVRCSTYVFGVPKNIAQVICTL